MGQSKDGVGRRRQALHPARRRSGRRGPGRCLNATGGTADAGALSAKMADAWLAFARTGDPNHPGLTHWPAVSPTATPSMHFDAVCAVRQDSDRAELAALKV